MCLFFLSENKTLHPGITFGSSVGVVYVVFVALLGWPAACRLAVPTKVWNLLLNPRLSKPYPCCEHTLDIGQSAQSRTPQDGNGACHRTREQTGLRMVGYNQPCILLFSDPKICLRKDRLRICPECVIHKHIHNDYIYVPYPIIILFYSDITLLVLNPMHGHESDPYTLWAQTSNQRIFHVGSTSVCLVGCFLTLLLGCITC